jgi:hypothetical protein
MRNKRIRIGLVLAVVLAGAGCVEMQRAVEDVARQSGNPRLASAIHGTGALVAGLLPIGYEEDIHR